MVSHRPCSLGRILKLLIFVHVSSIFESSSPCLGAKASLGLASVTVTCKPKNISICNILHISFFSCRYCQKGVWRVSGECFEGVWRISEGVWKVSGGGLEGTWKVLWRCQEAVRKMSGRFLGGIECVKKVTGKSHIRTVHGSHLEGVWKVSKLFCQFGEFLECSAGSDFHHLSFFAKLHS